MEKISVHNPYDGSLIEEVKRTSEEDSFAALESAYRLYRDRSLWLPAYRRIEILENTVDILKARALEFAETASGEGGKPLMDSKIEIGRAIDGIKIAVKEMLHFHGKEVPMNLTVSSEHRMAYTMREPRGVVMADQRV